jgi:hypothetical protein
LVSHETKTRINYSVEIKAEEMGETYNMLGDGKHTQTFLREPERKYLSWEA